MESLKEILTPIIGSEYRSSHTFTSENVVDFARLTQDDNPIHLDEAYAGESVFKQRVVHGMFVACLFSKIFGTIYPGQGSIYLSQTIKFSAPVFINDTIWAVVELKEYSASHKIGVFQTICKNQDDKIVLSGQAKVMFP